MKLFKKYEIESLGTFYSFLFFFINTEIATNAVITVINSKSKVSPPVPPVSYL